MKSSNILSSRVLFILIIILVVIGIFIYNKYFLLAQRQSVIHNKSSSVMPFDLSQTTHIFKKTNSGGIQQVISKDPTNTQQISLIRMHLKIETGLFQKGDFQDPVSLHGNTMPGVQDLSKGASQIIFTYFDIPSGGEIQYTTDNKSLIVSIHSWFDAQVSDHGSDAKGT